MSGLQALHRTHRVLAWVLIGLLALAWLASRWWYLKGTFRDRGGQTTVWVLSGRVTIFVRRGLQFSVPGSIAPTPGPGASLEFQFLASLGARPAWFWGFELNHEVLAASKQWTLTIPLWSVVAFLVATRVPVRAVIRRRRGRCPACGYDLAGTTSGVCPECGTVRRRKSPPPPADSSSGPASG